MFEPQSIREVVLIRTRRFEDARGFVAETFNTPRFAEAGLDLRFVQENESLSVRAGTVRGLHFQRAPFAQAKLVRCVRGAILDIAVDIREASPTFGRHVAVEIDARTGDQLYVPAGFAHGFCTLEADTLVVYKLDVPYAPKSEGGILWNDPALGIKWPVDAAAAIMSDRDRVLPRLSDLL